jgi:pimeloyl-ACP methyl ester carboxylesterase
VTNKVIERAVSFGLNRSLIGIVTEPAHSTVDLPKIIALNGGILPRSGRARIYVTLSRSLASRGYSVLRFDMSGIGDSLTRGDGLPPIDAAFQDIKDAVDWFVGSDGRVVVMGICDGANLAAQRASIDPRVVGAVLIDPLIPRTQRYRMLHFRRRIIMPTIWQEVAKGTHPKYHSMKLKMKALFGRDEAVSEFDPNDPIIRKRLSHVYQGMVDNKVEVFAIFTGGMQHRHCYREQLLDAFPEVKFTDRLRLEYFDAHDHHFEWPPHRAWLLASVQSWLTGLFPRNAVGNEPTADVSKISSDGQLQNKAI